MGFLLLNYCMLWRSAMLWPVWASVCLNPYSLLELAMTTSIKEFNEFVNTLANHDWYYEFSDDHRVYTRGRDQRKTLENQSKDNPLLQEAYNLYVESTGYNKSIVQTVIKRETSINKLRNQITNAQPQLMAV